MDTKEQIVAQSFDRHLAVTANAGSGKTRVLVQRYCDILFSRKANPANIVAITFTRKAAAEMLTRVVRKIEEQIAYEQPGAKLSRLVQIREALTYARITTIHSFCSSLLRDFPIEADVAPNFVELSASEILSIRQNAILSVLETWLNSADSKKERAQYILREFGRDYVEKYITSLLNKQEILPGLLDYYSFSNDEIYEKRNSFIIMNVIPGLLQKLFRFYDILQEIDNELIKKPDFVENLMLLHDFVKKVKSNNFTFRQELTPDANANDSTQIREFLTDFREITGRFLTNELTLYAKYAKGLTNPELKFEADEIAGSFDIVKKLQDSFEYDFKEPELYELSRTLLQIARDVIDEVDREKQEENGLDFDDLMLKSLELLKISEVRDKIRKKIRYLLVDEFQDTNDFQYEIIRQLVPELNVLSIDAHGINLFIVGDAKQSIYGFRNADVRVFNQARKDIINLNKFLLSKNIIPDYFDTASGKIVPEFEEDLYGDVKLTSTFRLQPGLTAFVDRVCGRIMAKKESDYDIDYSDFVCGRNVDGLLQAKENGGINHGGNFGSISLLLNVIKKKNASDESDNEDNDDKNQLEANLLANYLKKIIEYDKIEILDDKGNPKKAKYGDIAILARKRKGFGNLAKAFISKRIPYIIHSGRGFYETQEVTDIISFLNFVYNQNDDMSLAGILKSPFFDLSDTDLFQLSRIKVGEHFWEKLGNYDSKNAERAYHILSEILSIAPTLPVSRLILRFLSETGWYGTLAVSSAKVQIEANIEKLLKLARAFEEKGFRSLYDFVEELNFLSENSFDESEAVFLTGEDAVNVMTIHSSKGMEFPIVVLFATNETTANQDNLSISKELGIAFKVPHILDGQFKIKVNTPTVELSRQKKSLAEKAEEKRILYVAMTRAKDHLIFTGTLVENSKKEYGTKGLMNLLFSGIGKNAAELVNNSKLMLTNEMKVISANETKKVTINYNIDIFTAIDEVPGNQTDLPDIESNPNYLLGEMETRIENQLFSASKLILFDSNPEEYIEKYILGLPDIEVNIPQIKDVDNDSDNIIGTIAGTLIHQVFEDIKLWLGNDGGIHQSNLEKSIEYAVYNSGKNIRKELIERIDRECRNIAATQLIQRNAKNIRDAMIEYSMNIPVGVDFLTSKLDLLIKNNDGMWEIWDWKTNRVDSKGTISKLALHYELQMKVYCYFLSLMFPNQEKFSAKLLFTRLAEENTPDEQWTHSYNWHRQELDDFGKFIEKKIEMIKTNMKV